MNIVYRPIIMAVGLFCPIVSSCNPDDPSALSENQKTLDVAIAKNKGLENELAGLKAELAEAKSTISQSKAVEMPTAAEIESKLDLESTKLKEEARRQIPNSKVESFGTWDLDIPSFDRPFSCKAKVVLKQASGEIQTLYWTGSANMNGEWSFSRAKNLETKQASLVSKDDPAESKPSEFEPPVLRKAVADEQVKGGNENGRDKPTPPAVEKSKPKYDIPLDNPVLGPGTR